MFLRDIYREHKFLFGFCIVFIAGELFFTLMKLETTPFLLYGMYSRPVGAHNNYHDYIIKINGKDLDPYQLNDQSKEMIMSSIAYYDQLSRNDFNDPLVETIHNQHSKIPKWLSELLIKRLTNTTINAVNYRYWLKYYLHRFYKTRIDMLEIYRGTFQYDTNFKPQLVKTDTVFII